MIKFFEYKKIKFRFINFWNNNWKMGFFIKFSNIKINESSTSINYSQQCFEGIKCFLYNKKKYLKLKKNSFRFQKSNKKILSPIISIFNFIVTINNITYINKNYIPNIKVGYLYIRPLLLGIGGILGVKNSKKFCFLIYCCPVKSVINNKVFIKTCFLKKNIKNLGSFKLGCNYITSIFNDYYNKIKTFDDIIYYENEYFEEASTSNLILFYYKKLVTNLNKNILPGTNKINIIYLCKKKKYNILYKKINFNLINNSKIVITCGTAVFIKNLKSILFKNKIINYKNNFLIEYINFFKS
ncbi:branched-chain amino acid aminotransferase [Candidatus Carsonella ruddii PV]|uniref:Branched-chain amino acid aminotransferase n=1 Tax=Carsonella ruddii (strain PV) TaxID=387662 RepID=Q05FG8_CARRP|nr:aminotransferase class IV [Candidatus Carsonella ruddii]BAF35203.1 branched-chain amino acid aminotransferase [Candidatus Carsonella ruddii PV]